MSKTRRLHAPGCIVHITARTQGREPWFTEGIRTRVAVEIGLAGEASGHRVLAHAIMPNHFHLVVRQGHAPLAYLMHRVMHRSAALLKRTHKLEGHVFERRYWSGACLDPEYVRTAIVYVHLNPCRAGFCDDPAKYAWTSHSNYLRADAEDSFATACVREGLRFFSLDDTPASGRHQYLAFINNQLSVDQSCAGQPPLKHIVPPEPCTAGDQYWQTEYASSAQAFRKPEPDIAIHDIAARLLSQVDGRCPLDIVRSGTRARPIVIIRRQLIGALIARGYRGVAISRFFGVSETLVSRIAVGLRG